MYKSYFRYGIGKATFCDIVKRKYIIKIYNLVFIQKHWNLA